MAPGIIEIYPTIFAATTKVDKLSKSNLIPIKYPITTKALITPNHSAIEIKFFRIIISEKRRNGAYALGVDEDEWI